MNKITAIATIIAGLFLPVCAFSQIISEPDMKGINHSVFPVVGYSSDFGLFGGGMYQRIDYADGKRPFLSNTVIDVTGSTNGKWAGAFEYERTEMFGKPLRTRSFIGADRNPISTFFGIGNNTDFSTSSFDEGVYYLLQKRISASFEIRRPLQLIEDDGIIEGILRVQGSYTTNDDSGADTKFVISPPQGADGGWVNTIGAGLLYDVRNNEFDPRSGIRAEIGVDFSPMVAGNDYNFSTYFAEVSSYISLAQNIVFAQRIAGKHSAGSTPYYELPSLGNKDGLRGFAINRFIGNSSLLYMAEVRSWLFSFYEDEIKFGGHVFYDTGRVYSDFDSSGLFESWKNTWGIGGSMSVFNPDLIFRGEAGFSNESYRIYAGIGFAF